VLKISLSGTFNENSNIPSGLNFETYIKPGNKIRLYRENTTLEIREITTFRGYDICSPTFLCTAVATEYLLQPCWFRRKL